MQLVAFNFYACGIIARDNGAGAHTCNGIVFNERIIGVVPNFDAFATGCTATCATAFHIVN